MILTIPNHLSPIRSYIEKRYETDEIFREIYNDYLAYVAAHRFWSHNNTDVAPDRVREYANLVSELEKDLKQMLMKGLDEAF